MTFSVGFSAMKVVIASYGRSGHDGIIAWPMLCSQLLLRENATALGMMRLRTSMMEELSGLKLLRSDRTALRANANIVPGCVTCDVGRELKCIYESSQ